MNKILSDFLKNLEVHGVKNDEKVNNYGSKYLNLEKDAAELISLLIKLKQPKNILEIGTSNGYSTIWFASALNEGGKIVTVEKLKRKIEEAQSNFEKVKLLHKIELVESDAGEYFQHNNIKYDIIFLDANRKEYMKYVDRIESSLQKGGLIICDNAISHQDELSEFKQHFLKSDKYETITIPVGKGLIVATNKVGENE